MLKINEREVSEYFKDKDIAKNFKHIRTALYQAQCKLSFMKDCGETWLHFCEALYLFATLNSSADFENYDSSKIQYEINELRDAKMNTIDNKNYYTFVESVSDISNKSYGSKNGSIFEQTNNLFKPIEPSYDLIEYFDYDECVELMEKWNDTFNDLDFYRYRANTLCCFSNDELSEMITTLERRKRGISEYYKKETEKVNKQLTFIKGFCSENK